METWRAEREHAEIHHPGAEDRSQLKGTFDRHLFHFGWLFGAVGALAAFPFVVTHPHLPPGDPVGVINTVLDFPAWLLIHLGLMFVLPMMLIGLAAITRSIRDERTSASAAAALIVGIIGTIFGILGQGVDGVGFQIAAKFYDQSSAANKPGAVLSAIAVSGVAVGIFVLVLFFYFGFTALAFGLALFRTRGYPKLISLLALLGGVLGLTAAFITYFKDFSDPVYYGLFIPSAVIFLLWVLAASLHLWWTQVRHHRKKLKEVTGTTRRRRPPAAPPAPAGPARARAATKTPAKRQRPLVARPLRED